MMFAESEFPSCGVGWPHLGVRFGHGGAELQNRWRRRRRPSESLGPGIQHKLLEELRKCGAGQLSGQKCHSRSCYVEYSGEET